MHLHRPSAFTTKAFLERVPKRLPRQKSVIGQKHREKSMFHLSSGNIVEKVGQNEQPHHETHHQHFHLGLDRN